MVVRNEAEICNNLHNLTNEWNVRKRNKKEVSVCNKCHNNKCRSVQWSVHNRNKKEASVCNKHHNNKCHSVQWKVNLNRNNKHHNNVLSELSVHNHSLKHNLNVLRVRNRPRHNEAVAVVAKAEEIEAAKVVIMEMEE